VYILSRSACVWLADHPEHYHGVTGVASDVTLYRYWAERIVRDGDDPYGQVAVEYPPGSLPFIVAPEIVTVISYRSALIATMLLVDGLGLLGVVRVARRWGSELGPWLWVLLVPLIGPISFVRLDLVPAVATIWMVERASATRWGGVGAWLGAGTAAKLYPMLLLPMVALVSPIRRRTVVWAVLVMGLAFLPFVGVAARSVQQPRARRRHLRARDARGEERTAHRGGGSVCRAAPASVPVMSLRSEGDRRVIGSGRSVGRPRTNVAACRPIQKMATMTRMRRSAGRTSREPGVKDHDLLASRSSRIPAATDPSARFRRSKSR
jgi:hypothetical protein